MLTSFTKIFERIIKKRLVKFPDENQILSETQYGFRHGKSTNDTVTCLVDDLYTSIDNGQRAATTFLDLSKEFDTVDHAVLIKKLYKIGIRGKEFDLFKDNLNNRSQQVKVYTTFNQSIIEDNYLLNQNKNEQTKKEIPKQKKCTYKKTNFK